MSFRWLRTSMVGDRDQSLKFSACHLFTKLLDILPLPTCFLNIFCHAFALALSSFALMISCVSKFTILCAKIFTSRCRTDIRRGLYHMPPPKRSMENMTGKLLKLKTNLWWTGTCMMVWMALNRVSPRLKPLPSHSQAVTNSASRMERILS